MAEEKDVPRQVTGEEGGVARGHETCSADKRGWLRRLPPELPIFLFFFLVTLFLTWPLIIRFTNSIYGFPSDNLGNLWAWWWFRKAASFGASPSFCPIVGYPFGTHVNITFVEPVAELFERFLLLFMNEVLVYNLIIVSSFLLSGITMYYLVRHLTNDRKVAFFGGFAYLVCVYHSFNSMVFAHLAITQWMPLYILTLLWFIEKPNWKHAAFLCLSAILVAGTSIHYGMFMVVFTAAFLFGRLAYKKLHLRRERKKDETREKIPLTINRKTFAMSLLVILIVTVAIVPVTYFALSKTAEPGNWLTRPIPISLRTEEAYSANTAKPWDYLLPHIHNPLLGGITESINPDSNIYSGSNYIGWSVIVLALIAVIYLVRPGKKVKAPPRETGREGDRIEVPAENGIPVESRGIMWGVVLAAIVAFVLTLKPYVKIGSTRIPMPSALLRYLLPWYRWPMRMGIVVIICFMLLACFGLARLLRKKEQSMKVLILILVVLIIFLEMIIVPPFENINFKKVPTIFEKIASLPRGSAVAFYPMQPMGYYVSSYLILYQRWFLKPTLNNGLDNSDGEALRRTVFNPADPATPGILRRFGINYLVIFEQIDMGTGTIKASTLAPGLEKVTEFKGPAPFGNAHLYRITAPKASLVPIHQGDITVPAFGESRETTRLMEKHGILRILNFNNKDTRATLRLPVTNRGDPHELTIDHNGKPLWKGTLNDNQSTVAEISDISIPKDGLVLDLIVKGTENRLTMNDFLIFGTTGATLILGDLEIKQK